MIALFKFRALDDAPSVYFLISFSTNIFDRYEDVIWIPATSVECERFFSMVGLVFTRVR